MAYEMPFPSNTVDTGMGVDDIDLVGINEAFASVVLVCQNESGFDLAKST